MGDLFKWEDDLERDLANVDHFSTAIERKMTTRIHSLNYQYQNLKGHIPILKSWEHKVKLDIGGTIFCTTKETLTKHESYFKSLLSGHFTVETNPYDGTIFIDRSPELFRYILEFFRTGEIRDWKKWSKNDKLSLWEEVEFYCIEDMMQIFPEKMRRGIKKTAQVLVDYSEMTWDPKRMSSGMALRNNNMNAHPNDGSCSHKTVLGTVPITTGIVSFEVQCNQTADCYSAVGIVSKSFNFQGKVKMGIAPDSWALSLYPGSHVENSDRRSQAGSRLNSGDVCKVVYDADKGTLQFSVNGQRRHKFKNIDRQGKKTYIALTVCDSNNGGYTLRNVKNTADDDDDESDD